MDENTLITASQDAVAKVKALLANLDDYAAQLATINHKAGRLIQSADAMIWQGAVKRARGDLIAAHGIASKALIEGYGGDIVAAGPIR